MMNELSAIARIEGGLPSDELNLLTTQTQPTRFPEALLSQLDKLDESLKASSQLVERAASGESVSPHQVMIALEESRLHFSLAMQVRNRLLEAYQELTRMQV